MQLGDCENETYRRQTDAISGCTPCADSIDVSRLGRGERVGRAARARKLDGVVRTTAGEETAAERWREAMCGDGAARRTEEKIGFYEAPPPPLDPIPWSQESASVVTRTRRGP